MGRGWVLETLDSDHAEKSDLNSDQLQHQGLHSYQRIRRDHSFLSRDPQAITQMPGPTGPSSASGSRCRSTCQEETRALPRTQMHLRKEEKEEEGAQAGS